MRQRFGGMIFMSGALAVALLGGSAAGASAQQSTALRNGTKKAPAATKSAAPRSTAQHSLRAAMRELAEHIREQEERERDGHEQAGRKETEAKTDYEHVVERYNMLHRNRKGVVDFQAIAREQAKTVVPVARKGGKGPRINALGPGPVPATPTWTFSGPFGIQPPYQIYFGTQPLSGRVNAVAFDPFSPRTLYAAGAQGGVWRTDDAGNTWRPLTDTQQNLAVSSIAIDPLSPNVIYAGTGDYDGLVNPGFGILKSMDSGATWVTVNPANTFGGAAIRSIVIDPASYDPISNQCLTVFAAGGRYATGIWRTLDGGANWDQVLAPKGSVRKIVYSADHINLYAAVDRVGIYKSTDNGETWSLLPSRPAASYIDIATSQIDAGTVYALDDATQGVWKTVDAGATWRRQPASALNGQWAQSFYDFHINTSVRTPIGVGAKKNPVLTDAVYVGLLSLFLSPDGGTSWLDLGHSYISDTLLHSDQHSFAVNPRNANDMLVGCDGGAFRMVYTPAFNSVRFVSLNKNLGLAQFYHGASSPTDSTLLLGGTQDNASPQANGDLINWRNVGAGDGFGCAINWSDPFNPTAALRGQQNQYFTVYDNAVVVTEDNWNNTAEFIPLPATTLPEIPTFFTQLRLSAANPLLAYTATTWYRPLNVPTGFVYEYTHPALGTANTNTTWKKFANDFKGEPLAIASAPYDQATIFVGTEFGTLWVSHDQGSTFTQIDGGAFGGFPITSIVVSKFFGGDHDNLWVCTGGVGAPHFYSVAVPADPTQTVVTAPANTDLPDLPAYTLLLGQDDKENTFYIGTDTGVYLTTDGGDTWTDFGVSLGLPRIQVNELTYSYTTGTMTAFTFGRGTWQITTGNNIPLTFYPNLQSYKGDRRKLRATIELYLPGTDRIVDGRTVSLSADGWIRTNISYSGAFDLRIRVPGFLSQFVPNVATGSPFTTPVIYNGDVDGSNTITTADVDYVTARLGQYRTAGADVDGDGRVTLDDVKIVQGNLGRSGR